MVAHSTRYDTWSSASPARRVWIVVSVGAVVAGGFGVQGYFLLTRSQDHSADFRAVPGVTDVSASFDWGPDRRSVRKRILSYMVTVRADPDARTLDRVLAVEQGLRGYDVPPQFSIQWTAGGRERSYGLAGGPRQATGAELVALPRAPGSLALVEDHGAGRGSGEILEPSCTPARFVSDCMLALQTARHPVDASAWDPHTPVEAAARGLERSVSFQPDEARRLAPVYARAVAAAPDAQSVLVWGRAEDDGTAQTPMDTVAVTWGTDPRTGVPVARSRAKQQLAAVMAAMGPFGTTVRVLPTIP